MHLHRHFPRLKTVVPFFSTVLLCCGAAWGDISISPSTAKFSSSGGNGSLSVNVTSPDAPVGPVQIELTGTDGVVSFPSGNSAAVTLKKAGTAWKGTGKFKYQVAPNPSGVERQRTISVNGGSPSLTINQAGAACKPVVAKNLLKQSVPYFGGDGAVSFSIPDGCPWSASADSGWLSIGSDASGTSSGEVSFSSTDNSALKAKARNGKITITGLNPSSPSKAAGKVVVSVSQGQRTGAGSARIEAPAQLSDPAAVAKGLMAAALVSNVVTGSGDGVNSMLSLFSSSSSASPKTVKGMQKALSLARIGERAASSSQSFPCDTGNGTVTSKGSTFKAVFSACSYGGMVLDGTVSGSYKTSGSSTLLSYTFGTTTSPFLATVYNGGTIVSSTKASLSMVVSPTGQDSESATINGTIDIADNTANVRDLLDFKNYSYDYTSDGTSATYAVDGALRNVTFQGTSMTAAEETAFSNFTVRTSGSSSTSSVAIDGTFALLFYPADQCTSGTFQVATVPSQPIVIAGSGLQSGRMTINGATVAIGTSNGQPTITVNDVPTGISLGSVCSGGAAAP